MAGSKIPTAADLPQVAPQSLRGVRVGDISGGMNEAVQEGGQAGGDLFLGIRDKAEATEAQDLINQLRDKQRLLMDGDGSEQNPGYSNLTGKTAVDERNNYEVKYQTDYDDLFNKASSSRVQAQIIKQFGAQRNTFLTNVSRHQGGQRIKYEDQVHTTASDNLTELAISEATFDEATKAWGNKKTIAEQHAANIQHYRKRTGDAKVAKDMADEARSKTHVEVIDDLLTRAGGGVSAEKYFNAHVGEIDQKVKNELRTRIENGSRLDTAQTFADDTIKKFVTANPTKSERELMSDVKWQRDTHAEIGRKFSGETEKEVRAEFDRRIARFTKQENSLDAEATYKATEFLATNRDKSLLDFLTTAGNKAEAKRIMSDPRLFGALVTLSRNIGRAQTAEEFASSNNKQIKETHEKMTGEELRQIPDAAFNTLKEGLTETVWNKLNTTRNTAKRKFESKQNPNTRDVDKEAATIMKEVAAQIPTRFDFSTVKKAGVKKHLRVNAAVLRQRVEEWLDRTIEASKGPDGKKAPTFPEDDEIRREVMRLTAKITADPVNTGEMFFPKTGEESISGMVMRLGPFRDKAGRRVTKMSPAQLAVARVPFKSIPEAMLERIRNNIRRSPDPMTKVRTGDEGFIENVAGAFVTKNEQRLKRLLGVTD